MTFGLKNIKAISAFSGASALILGSGPAMAQSQDDFDASVATGAAVGIACSQDVSFGTLYVGASNPETTVALTAGGSLNSTHTSVAISGGVVGLCSISGLQSPDSAILVIFGGDGTPADSGLENVSLSDGASHTLSATIETGGGGIAVGGGRIGIENGVFPIFGTVTIPASHVDFGTYTVTITAMVVLN